MRPKMLSCLVINYNLRIVQILKNLHFFMGKKNCFKFVLIFNDNLALFRFSSVKQQSYGAHPLEKREKNRFERQQYQDLAILRTQLGIHAPLRLLTERKAASQIGHLPILPRSNFQLEVLDGRDELISPEDIFNGKFFFSFFSILGLIFYLFSSSQIQTNFTKSHFRFISPSNENWAFKNFVFLFFSQNSSQTCIFFYLLFFSLSLN